jgi:hypothetical protein
MSYSSVHAQPTIDSRALATGVGIGLAGGFAEIGVVSLYAALTGTDAGDVARQVAVAVGLPDVSVASGVMVHLALSVGLGVALVWLVQLAVLRPMRTASVVGFMTACLAVVWAVNFFIVLPRLSPGFVTLLPYGVTLASKLMFGVAAGLAFCRVERRWLAGRSARSGMRLST